MKPSYSVQRYNEFVAIVNRTTAEQNRQIIIRLAEICLPLIGIEPVKVKEDELKAIPFIDLYEVQAMVIAEARLDIIGIKNTDKKWKSYAEMRCEQMIAGYAFLYQKLERSIDLKHISITGACLNCLNVSRQKNHYRVKAMTKNQLDILLPYISENDKADNELDKYFLELCTTAPITTGKQTAPIRKSYKRRY